MITKFDIHQYIDKFYILYPYKRTNRPAIKDSYNINYIRNITYNNGWYSIERIIINGIGVKHTEKVRTITHNERPEEFVEFVKNKKLLTPQELVDNYPNDVVLIFNNISENDEYRDIMITVFKNTNADILINANKYNI